MASGTAVEIEARTQAFGNRIDFPEDILRTHEKLKFGIVEALQRTSRSGISASHTRVGGPTTRRRATGVIVLPLGGCIDGRRIGRRRIGGRGASGHRVHVRVRIRNILG
jgi:hypothetical protein